MTIHNDNKIKIEYNEQFNSSAIPQNVVGATASTTLRSLDFTPSNDNSIFVSKSGIDTGAGTQADPVLTINRAVSLCTSIKSRVVIIDDGIYQESWLDFPSDVYGLYALIGKTPTLELSGSPDVKSAEAYSPSEAVRGLSTCYLSNGNIFLIWQPASGGLMFRVLNKDGFLDIIEPTIITVSPGADERLHCCLTATGDIFIIGNNSNSMVYFILSTSTWQVIYNSGVLNYYWYNHPVLLDNGNILLFTYYASGTNNGLYYGIINSVTHVLGSLTRIGTGNNAPRGATIDGDGNVSIIYAHGQTFSNAVMYRRTYTQDMSVVDGETTFSSSGIFVWGIARWDIYIVIMYSKGFGIGQTGIYYKIVDSSYNDILSEHCMVTNTVLIAQSVLPRVCTSSYGTLVIVWGGVLESNYGPAWYGVARVIAAYMRTRNNIIFDGVTVHSPNAETGMERIFLQGGALRLKHVTVQDIPEFSTGDCMALTLNKDKNAFTFQNVLMCKNTLNMLLESDNVTVNQSLFYANRKNPALEIDGAGAGISLTKNTFFNNYGAIKLLNNDGNEIINNSIFHDNLNYDVSAETALTVNNSISTGLMIVAALNSANCLQADPRFINDGFVDDEDLNVDIRLRVLGYPCDSPAYKFASDGKNTGAIDVLYNYAASTYDSCMIQKPEKFIIEYRPVGAVKNIMIDGTVNTAKQGQIIAIIAEWKGILKEDWESLHDVWLKGKMVRLYPDPITHPEQYRAMRIEFSNIQGSTDYYGLDGDGKQNIKMVFAARYLDV